MILQARHMVIAVQAELAVCHQADARQECAD